jgi:SEC-C motif-containing protein
MSEQDLCPCGSNQPLAQCCGPYLAGEQLPATAEALMRSRYTAYTLQDDNYLLETWHPDTRPGDPHPSNDGDGSVWTGLNIVRTEQGRAGDSEGVVEFVARCDIKGTPAQLHEISQFSHEDGRWWYVDGQNQQPLRRAEPKVGRNDPCPCGSGKKYKKCCGA